MCGWVHLQNYLVDFENILCLFCEQSESFPEAKGILANNNLSSPLPQTRAHSGACLVIGEKSTQISSSNYTNKKHDGEGSRL